MEKTQASDEVVEFIRRRFKNKDRWMDGNCYFFAVILKERFKHLHIVYCPVPGHFMAHNLQTNTFYDFLGQHSITEAQPYYNWETLKTEEPSLYNRIRHDCCL